MVAGDWVVGSAPRVQGRHTTNTAAQPPGRGHLPNQSTGGSAAAPATSI
jgi:hypothetical protein